MKRRKFINRIGLGVAGAAITGAAFSSPLNSTFASGKEPEEFDGHKFPELPYSYDALEPYIDRMTMEIHYDRHHRGYFKKFISAIKGKGLEKTTVPEIFSKISSYSSEVRNSSGGYYNHTLFWENMSGIESDPSEDLEKAITESFGSISDFKAAFSNEAKSRFGSGWAWLVMTRDKKLKVGSTPNQDNPLMNDSELKGYPLLTLDVWEHAYYLKYQNKRGNYINAFWNVVNWDEVSKRFNEALKD